MLYGYSLSKVCEKFVIISFSGRSRGSPGSHIKGPRGFSYKVKSSGTDESQPFARAKANILVQEKQVEEGKGNLIYLLLYS
ncbi:hypothetical protein LguiA_024385 [Lonicera macranthoides]